MISFTKAESLALFHALRWYVNNLRSQFGETDDIESLRQMLIPAEAAFKKVINTIDLPEVELDADD